MTLFKELRRRNVFKVASVYLVTSWCILQIISVISPFLNLPKVFGTGITVVLISAFPIACIFAWAFELTPEGLKRTHEVDQDDSIRLQTGKKINLVLSSLVLLVLGFVTYGTLQDNTTSDLVAPSTILTKNSESSTESSTASVISIAVLPFVNMSSDAEQEYFVDGLTEEMLNSLARVKGLLVMGRTSSFAYKNKNIDLRQIAEELDVNYLIEGSVRKSADKIRITVQLIEASSGAHIFSEAFDRDLVDVFIVQEEISQQIAAALKLSLVHENTQYNLALTKLDHISVEQLVIARAQIGEYAVQPIRKALKTLAILNQNYPNTAEIIGLQSYGMMILTGINGNLDLESLIILAKQAININPTNIDALITLGVIYEFSANTKEQAKQMYQNIIRYHPGTIYGYHAMLDYLEESTTPCAELKDFVLSMPVGVFGRDKLFAANRMIDTCLTPERVTSLPMKISEGFQHHLDRYQLYFGSKTDNNFVIQTRWADKNPNQMFLSDLLLMQNSIGAFESAKKTLLQMKNLSAPDGFRQIMAYLSKYMYELNNSDFPDNAFDFYQHEANNMSDIFFVAALVKEATNVGSNDAITRYLSGVPDFPINVVNSYESVGLMMLQYQAGQISQSHKTATKLLKSINEYQQKHPASFQFYGLASSQLVAAFYSNELEQVSTILQDRFTKDYAYWADDIAVMTVALSPWSTHPTVVSYLNLIEQDRERVRAKFDID